ncbi:serine/threonine protein kinase [Pyxidicoccus sp. 3LG]
MAVHAENFQVSPDALGPGTEVGPWCVVERLGVGGFGAVYRVEDTARPGEFYALKLALRPGEERAEREVILLMSKAVHPHVVRLHACGRWPHPRTGFLYFVMDWVEGRALHTWAEEVNPSFRALAQAAGKVALALDALHLAGVRHRDIKPEHIMLRDSDGEPRLIDFGIGDYSGAATITHQTVPPGTPHLRSPEAVRFHRENHGRPEARYAFQPTDDLYALGATLYRVVTGHCAFPPHLPLDLLYLSIERELPPAPAAFNRRVPRALSDIIVRLLAKDPQERYPTGAELHAALVAAVSFGKPAAWEASIFDWAEEPSAALEAGGVAKQRIRRPEWPTRSATPPAPRLVLAPRLPMFRNEARREQAESVGAHAGTRPGKRPRPNAAVGIGFVLLASMLGLAAWGMYSSRQRPEPDARSGSTSRTTDTQPRAHVSFREVAPPGGPPEADRAAAPPQADPIPVAVASPAARANEDSPVTKQQQKPSTHPLKQAGRKTLGVAGTCLGLACSSAPVRPPPPLPEACPPEVVKLMRELGIRRGDAQTAMFNVIKGEPRVLPVSPGPFQLRLVEGWEGLGIGAVLSGQLYITDRVYARFTVASTRDGRFTYPVCMELVNERNERGLDKEPGSNDSSTLVWGLGRANPVDHFQ